MIRKRQASALRVNIPMVCRVLGYMLLIETVFMLAPLATALVDHDMGNLKAFAISAAVTFAAGAAVVGLIRPAYTDMGKREGFMLTALVWVVYSFFGMLPFMLSPQLQMNVTDAFFEAMSGFTTTGASLIDLDRELGHAVHMWRCLSQWIGGMGIIIFTLAVIPMLDSAGGMQMFNAEVTGITHEKLRPRISQTAKHLWEVYVALTAMAFLLLWFGPMSAFDAACHAMATLSTGGFSTSMAGIDGWNSVYVKTVVTVFMFLGGVNIAFIFRAAAGEFSFLRRNEAFMAYVKTILLALVVFAVAIWLQGAYTGWQSVTIDPLFQIVSSFTSTGYTLSSFDSWGPLVLSITMLLMFSGACAGSTSGGAKIDRFLVLGKFLRNELRRCIRPNAVFSVRLNKSSVPGFTVSKTVAFLVFYVLLFVAGGLLLSAMGVPMFDAVFSAFACISNTGLDAQITGYGTTYMHIPGAGRWVLAMLMLTGRLELFTVIILFTRSFWRK